MKVSYIATGGNAEELEREARAQVDYLCGTTHEVVSFEMTARPFVATDDGRVRVWEADVQATLERKGDMT